MKTRIITIITILTLIMSCSSTKSPSPKVWAWVSGSLTMTNETLEHYFSKCKEVGIEAIMMECHSGKPVVLDSTTFRDSAALEIIRR